MKDKLYHFAAGAGITLFGCFMGHPEWGVILAVMTGAAKEFIDTMTGSGKPEFMDFFATCAGAIVALAAWLAFVQP